VFSSFEREEMHDVHLRIECCGRFQRSIVKNQQDPGPSACGSKSAVVLSPCRAYAEVASGCMGEFAALNCSAS
jgi:hypothetical protein